MTQRGCQIGGDAIGSRRARRGDGVPQHEPDHVATLLRPGVSTARSPATAAHPVDLTTVSFRRAAGTSITHCNGLERVVAFGWRRAVILEALGRGCGIDSLRDEFGDIDDPLALVDARFDMITRSHR